MTQPKKEKEKKTNADTAWKDMIEEYFESLLEFFFPTIHRDIDFSRGVRFLSTELRQILPDHDVGNRYADELVEVYLKNGSVRCICVFIHIELQGKKTDNFILRMFTYHYHILDRYRKKGIEAVSLAVLTDTDKKYRPEIMSNKRWGFELTFKIPLVKLIEYDTPEAIKKLQASDSPWAMVIIAQLKSNKVIRKDPQVRSDAKFELCRACYERGYSKEKIIMLLKFIDWLILLPKEYEAQLRNKFVKYEEKVKMPYTFSWEKTAEERGEKRGEERGVEIGEKRGRHEGKREEKIEFARKLIHRNFPISDIVDLTGLTEKEIETLMH